jgi:hypothetical protein
VLLKSWSVEIEVELPYTVLFTALEWYRIQRPSHSSRIYKGDVSESNLENVLELWSECQKLGMKDLSRALQMKAVEILQEIKVQGQKEQTFLQYVAGIFDEAYSR